MTMKKLEEVCLGHLTSLKKECKGCKEDEFNKNCDKYIPMQTFNVRELTKREQSYEDERLGMWY